MIVVLVLSFLVQFLAVTANYVNYEIALRGLYPTDWADPLKYGPPALFNPAHSPVLGQIRLLLENLTANLDLGWVWTGRVAWEVPALAGGIALLAGLTWLLAGRRGARRLAPVTAAVAVTGRYWRSASSPPEFTRRGPNTASMARAMRLRWPRSRPSEGNGQGGVGMAL